MKKLYTLLFTLLTVAAIAQVAPPQGINYQAVARTNTGTLLSNATMNVRLTILSDTANSIIQYQELHNNVTTNQFGLFTLVIGQGTSTGAGLVTFTNIPWGTNNTFFKIEVDNGQGYFSMGTIKFWSVPYAFFAGSVQGGAQGATGATGPTGPAGNNGAVGPQGATGPAGPAGPTGADGPVGANGPQGVQGVTGPAGAQGPAGPQGPTGVPGVNGTPGIAGPTGPQGSAGPTGATGNDGIQGPAGPTGPAGVGVQGPTGPTGTVNTTTGIFRHMTNHSFDLGANYGAGAIVLFPAPGGDGTDDQLNPGSIGYKQTWVAPHNGKLHQIVLRCNRNFGNTTFRLHLNQSVIPTYTATAQVISGVGTVVTFTNATFNQGDLLSISIQVENGGSSAGAIFPSAIWEYTIQ